MDRRSVPNAAATQFRHGMSDGVAAAGRQLAKQITGGQAYGQSIAEVFGPLPELGGTPGFSRENVSLEAMNRAYVGKHLDIMVPTMELLLAMFPSAVARVLPMIRTDNLTIRVFKFNADRSILGIVPDFAPAPVLTQGTTEFTQVLERRGRAIEIGNAFWMTDEGKASLAMKTSMLRAVVLASMDAERYFAIFNAPHSDMYNKAILSNGGLPFNDLLDLFGAQNDIVGCAHRTGGFLWLDERLSIAFDEGASPDTYFIPPGLATLIALADPANTNFSQHGPGNQRYLEQGRRAIASFRGKTCIEVPTLVIDDWNEVVNMAVRVRPVGTYAGLYDPYPGCTDFTSARTDTLIYNMSNDTTGGWYRVGMGHLIENCGMFEGNGYSRKAKEFCDFYNANRNSFDKSKGQHLGNPFFYVDSADKMHLAQMIGDMPLELLPANAVEEIVRSFIDRFDVSGALRTQINKGLELAQLLQRPNLTREDALLWMDMVAAAAANSPTGMVPANAFGTLDIASIAVPAALGKGATALGITAADLTTRYTAALASTEPYGYGTWAGLMTLASTPFPGGSDPVTRQQVAKEFVDAVKTIGNQLQAVFLENPAFDAGFCPFFLRGGRSPIDEQMCVFVHGLLTGNVTPTYVQVTGTGVMANSAKLFTAPSARAPADTRYDAMNRQLAYALGEVPAWQAATDPEGAATAAAATGASAAAGADARRNALNQTFLAKETEWSVLLGVSVNPTLSPAERAGQLAGLFADRYLASVGAGGAVLRKEGGSYEPALKIAINAIRFNLGQIGLPDGSTVLDDRAVREWAHSGASEHRIVPGAASFTDTAVGRDLNNALDSLGAGAATTAWINTRLFIDNESFRKLAQYAQGLPTAADRARAMSGVAFRPANPDVVSVPITGPGFMGTLTGAQADALINTYLQLVSVYEEKDPLKTLLASDDTYLDALQIASSLTRMQYQQELERIGSQTRKARFTQGDQLVTRWMEFQQRIADPLVRALCVMYTLQFITPNNLRHFYKNNIPLPFEGGLARPDCRYNFGAVALVQSGENLGGLYICNDQVVAGNDPIAQIWTLQYFIHYAAVIHDHNLLMVVADVGVLGYIQGEGITFVNVHTLVGDIFAIVLPYGANKRRCEVTVYNNTYPLDLAGFYPQQVYQDKVHQDNTRDWALPTYASWAFTNFLYGFNKAERSNPLDFKRFSDVRTASLTNTQCPQGAQYHASGPQAGCVLTTYKMSRDVWGPWVATNDKTLRKLPSNVLRESVVPPSVPQYMEE